MAMAAAYLREAVAKFGEAQSFAQALGGAYKSNFDAKLQAARELLAKAENENKTIYYEPMVNAEDLPKPDPQNYVSLEACTEELGKPSELDGKLRHLVPPAVRAMQEELKNQIQGIIQEEFTKISQFDEQMTAFLKQYGLPECLHTITAGSDVPDAVWSKIEEFQKKGAAQNFAQAIQGAQSMKDINNDIIADCEKQLNEEEAEDTQLRAQYGAAFNRPPSASVNAQYKQSIFEYKQKIEMASTTDV